VSQQEIYVLLRNKDIIGLYMHKKSAEGEFNFRMAGEKMYRNYRYILQSIVYNYIVEPVKPIDSFTERFEDEESGHEQELFYIWAKCPRELKEFIVEKANKQLASSLSTRPLCTPVDIEDVGNYINRANSTYEIMTLTLDSTR
jgi:hypothetical protein